MFASIRRYFEPHEVGACRLALWQIRPLFKEVRSADAVLIPVADRLDQRKWRGYIARSLEGGTSPRDFILATVLDVAQPELISGYRHVYSGILDSTGSDIDQVFDIALRELVKSGFVSEQYAKERRAFVTATIARMG